MNTSDTPMSPILTKFSSDTSMSSTLSVEQERDSLKEKLEHMKYLFKQIAHENQSQQINKESVSNLSRLLQEARQENANLQKRLKGQEAVIKTLQSRLTSNGLSGSINLEETDLFVPGTSNQVLDNLVKEIQRLRTLLRGASTDPEEVEKLRQNVKYKDEQIDEVTLKSESQLKQIKELESLLESSADEKDVKISELKALVRRMQDDSQTRDVLCHSLAEETTNLRQQLHDVAVTCQQMALRLDRAENGKKSTDSSKSSKGSDGNTSETEHELQEKLKEVILMNKRWQEYDRQRDNYVQELQAIIRTLNDKAKKLEENQLSPERTRQINEAIEEAQQNLKYSLEEKRKLQSDLIMRDEQLAQRANEIDRLRNELEQARQGGSFQSDIEIVEALKAQVQICTEDFESERKDREKAQSRVMQLESEVEKLKMDIAQRDRIAQPNHVNYIQQAYRNPHNQDFYNDFNIPNVYPQNHDVGLAARGPGRQNVADTAVDSPPDGATVELTKDIATDNATEKIHVVGEQLNLSESEFSSIASMHFPSFLATDDDLDVVEDSENESARNSVTADNSDLGSEQRTNSANKSSNMLSCPKCHKEYLPEKHADLMEHIVDCCD